eukprot:4113580-Amphidinium_carterae.2
MSAVCQCTAFLPRTLMSDVQAVNSAAAMLRTTTNQHESRKQLRSLKSSHEEIQRSLSLMFDRRTNTAIAHAQNAGLWLSGEGLDLSPISVVSPSSARDKRYEAKEEEDVDRCVKLLQRLYSIYPINASS